MSGNGFLSLKQEYYSKVYVASVIGTRDVIQLSHQYVTNCLFNISAKNIIKFVLHLAALLRKYKGCTFYDSQCRYVNQLCKWNNA